MVSTELLRRYTFFAGCSPAHLDAIAMLSEEVAYKGNETVFESGQSADALYLLMDGCVDLHYNVADPIYTELRKDFFISEFNVGEPFGVSALIEPYRYEGTVCATRPSRAIKIEAAGLRELCRSDPMLDLVLTRQMLRAVVSRLDDTRVLLAASRE
jgi:CRP-like cAMP-binding protein